MRSRVPIKMVMRKLAGSTRAGFSLPESLMMDLRMTRPAIRKAKRDAVTPGSGIHRAFHPASPAARYSRTAASRREFMTRNQGVRLSGTNPSFFVRKGVRANRTLSKTKNSETH